MHPDPNCPARSAEQASGERVGHVEPETLAHRLFAQIVDTVGDAEADLHLARVISKLLEISPVAREHISDLLIADLVEELHRHGQAGRDAAKLVGVVQRDWMNERG